MTKEALISAYRAFRETRAAISATEDVPRYVGWRENATAMDVLTAVEMLIGDYDEAQAATRDARVLMRQSPPGDVFDRTRVPTRRVISSFKFVYMAVRAYQDAACGVLYELLGKHAGRYTSMADALKKEANPVRVLLSERLPEYIAWLPEWKKRRDQVKIGASFALLFDGEDNLSIKFEYPFGEQLPLEVIEEAVALQDLVEGLEMSTRLANLIHELGDGVRVAGMGPV